MKKVRCALLGAIIMVVCMAALVSPALVSASGTTEISGVIPRTVHSNINGSAGTWYVNDSGVLLQDVSQWSPARDVTVNISAGTELLGPDSKPINEFIVTAVSSPPAPPAGTQILAAFDFKPDGASFYPDGIQISIKFDPSKVPAGGEPIIAFYNASAGAWQYIAGVIDSSNTAVFIVYHFTIYGVLSPTGQSIYNPFKVNYEPMPWNLPPPTAPPAPTSEPAAAPVLSSILLFPEPTLEGMPAPTAETGNTEEEEQMKAPNLTTPTPAPTVISAITSGSGSHHHNWFWLLLIIIWSLVVVLWLLIIFVVLKRYKYERARQ